MTITRHHPGPLPDRHPDNTLDETEVFRFLGYNPTDPAARAVVGLCLRYQLDPFAGHIIVIQGRRSPYVTRDGHLFLAHRSGQLDGIEVLEEWVKDEKTCYAKVAVWRKDMGHPFVYIGRAPLKRGNSWDEHADKKAVANAEVRALKRAFPLQLPSIVDYEDDLDQDPTPRSASTPEPEVDPAHQGGVPTEADRSGVEAANHEGTHRPGVGEPPPDATSPPGGPPKSPPGRPSGGTNQRTGR